VSFSNYFDKEIDVTITQTHYLYFEDSSVELMKGESKTLTPVNVKKWELTWSSSDESVATVDENGKVTAVAGGGAVITVTSKDGNHTDQIAVSVQEPKDLKDNLVGSNEPGYESVDGVKVMTSLDCTITNNSDNTIQLDEVSLYCDGEYKKSKALNRTLNKEGGSYTYTFPIDIEYEEIPDNPEEGGKPSEGESTEEKSNDESSNGSRAGTRDDSETKKKPKENTHKYQVVWDYTYGGEKFKFYYPESTETKKASTRRASTRRR
ncbi:MAG: Ig-like domain-containing protein, partial [Lachnospiraceae bacterium]|nr:Ig-like domain-containing protein [Lachnospiraceae bacterium]